MRDHARLVRHDRQERQPNALELVDFLLVAVIIAAVLALLVVAQFYPLVH